MAFLQVSLVDKGDQMEDNGASMIILCKTARH